MLNTKGDQKHIYVLQKLIEYSVQKYIVSTLVNQTTQTDSQKETTKLKT